jgi:hypothetical protein
MRRAIGYVLGYLPAEWTGREVAKEGPELQPAEAFRERRCSTRRPNRGVLQVPSALIVESNWDTMQFVPCARVRQRHRLRYAVQAPTGVPPDLHRALSRLRGRQ